MTSMGKIDKLLMLFPHKFYQLLLIVGVNLEAKSLLLRELAKDGNYFYINLNLSLSERLMAIPSHERCLYINQYIDEIVQDIGNKTILFDHIGILFEKSMKINPLALLKNLSRHRKLIASWPGAIKNNSLIYAKPGHPEYVIYPIEVDYTVLDMDELKP